MSCLWSWFFGGYSESRIRFGEFMTQLIAMRRSLAGLDYNTRRLIDVLSARAGQVLFSFGLATEQTGIKSRSFLPHGIQRKPLYPFPRERQFMSVTITTTQQVQVSAKFVDRRGNEAAVDGIPEWLTDNANVLDITPSGDGRSCLIKAVGIPGSALVQVTADADLGDGLSAIVGTIKINVVPAPAVNIELEAGKVEEQPD